MNIDELRVLFKREEVTALLVEKGAAHIEVTTYGRNKELVDLLLYKNVSPGVTYEIKLIDTQISQGFPPRLDRELVTEHLFIQMKQFVNDCENAGYSVAAGFTDKKVIRVGSVSEGSDVHQVLSEIAYNHVKAVRDANQ